MKQKSITILLAIGIYLISIISAARLASAATCSYSFPQQVLPSSTVPVELTGVAGHTYEAEITLAVGPSIPITATGTITGGSTTTINITAPDNTLNYQLIVTDTTGGSPQEVCTPESGALLSVVSVINRGTGPFPLPQSQAEARFSADTLVAQIITAILPIILGLAGFITVIIIVISGIQFVTSSGNPEAAAAARGRLIMALVGFAIIILAFAITQIINTIFLGSNAV